MNTRKEIKQKIKQEMDKTRINFALYVGAH